jgi:hypothetical protein
MHRMHCAIDDGRMLTTVVCAKIMFKSLLPIESAEYLFLFIPVYDYLTLFGLYIPNCLRLIAGHIDSLADAVAAGYGKQSTVRKQCWHEAKAVLL